jgi:hypothetical protein
MAFEVVENGIATAYLNKYANHGLTGEAKLSVSKQ